MEKKIEFENFILESFEDGIISRELRLSEEELIYMKEFMPKAIVEEMPDGKCADGKTWYKVHLSIEK